MGTADHHGGSMTLANRLAVSMFAIALVTAIVVSVIVRERASDLLDPLESARHTHVSSHLASLLEARGTGLREDVLVASHSAPAEGLLASSVGEARSALRRATSDAFCAQLLGKPQYLQLRLIGTANGGREIVRVERVRAGEPPRVVPESELREGELKEYLKPMAKLAAGQVYVSPSEWNREHGVTQTVPVLRAATPITDDGGHLLGVVMILVDLTRILDTLRSASSGWLEDDKSRVYVADERGNFLVHPRDHELALARDLSEAFEREFTRSGELLSIDRPVTRKLEWEGTPFVVAAAPLRIAKGPRLFIITAAPSSMASAANQSRHTTLLIGLLVTSLAAIGTFFVARAITRPLVAMAAVVRNPSEHTKGMLPTDRNDEIGVLARAFQRMSAVISERTARLDREERKFHSVVEAAPYAVLIIDSQRTIVLANRSAEALLGYSHAELVGGSVNRLIPERFLGSHDEHVTAFFSDAVARTMGKGRDLFVRRKNGGEVPVEVGLSPIDALEGRSVLVTIVDVTARRQALLANERLAALVESSDDGIISTTLDGVITGWNQGAERLFGYTAEEAVGRSLRLIVPEQCQRAEAKFLEQVSLNQRADHFETVRRCKNGHLLDVSITLSPIRDASGVIGVSSIARDITESKRRDAELQRSNADLEQFAYIASHDLQEPLRTVANYTELLARRYQGKLDERADKYIYYASDGARRMQRLVADLLAYARVDSQGKPFVPVSSNSVLRAVLELLHSAIFESGASVRSERLPEVLADEGQLSQVFQNLIGNAIKFRSDQPLSINVRAVREGRNWRFSVEDNGIGMEMQYKNRIFQMFQRLHERGRFEGSGIGLSIVKRIIERHGGAVWVESEPNRGTTFFFTIPAVWNETAEANGGPS